jgi:hypothetical protein
MPELAQPIPHNPKAIFHTLLVFRAPTTLSEALADHASQRGISLSALIRNLLVAGLTTDSGQAAVGGTGNPSEDHADREGGAE